MTPLTPPAAPATGGARVIGVAVAVPEPFGEQLRAHRASFGDQMAANIPTHVTLLPPTLVEPGGGDVEAHLAGVAAVTRPFAIHLRGTATFRPVSPVVFVQLVEGIGECEVLERAVRSGPLARELAFYYHPHVTVAHHLPDAALDTAFDTLAGFECRFEVAAFHLYEHGDDDVWRPQQAFGFGGDGSDGGGQAGAAGADVAGGRS